MARDTNVSMFSVLRKHFTAWRETTENSGLSCKYMQQFKSYETCSCIHVSVVANMSIFQPAGWAQSDSACFSKMYLSRSGIFQGLSGWVSYLFICLAVNWKIERNVVQYEQKFRGRELPGFVNYKTFEEIVKEQIGQLEEPALLKLKEVSGKVFNVMPHPGLAMKCVVFKRIACLTKTLFYCRDCEEGAF